MAGVHGLYICGGTGEGLLMTVDERQEALEVVLDEVDGRAAVITHIGSFSTEGHHNPGQARERNEGRSCCRAASSVVLPAGR